jgi:signal peptidase II
VNEAVRLTFLTTVTAGYRRLFWFLAPVTFLVDQVTKLLLWSPPAAGRRPLVLVPQLLSIISHPGNVRGALGLGPEGRYVYAAAAVIGLAVVALFLLTTPPANRRAHAALGLLAGGAMGNLLDRLALGFVRDFIDLYWQAHHWHTFNVADAAICVGFAVLVYDSFFAGARSVKEGREPAGSGAEQR